MEGGAAEDGEWWKIRTNGEKGGVCEECAICACCWHACCQWQGNRGGHHLKSSTVTPIKGEVRGIEITQ